MTTYHTKTGEMLFPRLPKNTPYLRIRPFIGGDVLDWSNPNEFNIHDLFDCIKLPLGDWEIVGPIYWETYSTESNPLGGGRELKFDFDPEPFVENLFTKEAWKDYRITENLGWASYPLLTPQESFISLIESKGEILFSNHSPHPVDIEPNSRAHYDSIVDEWQENERKLLKSEEQIIVIKKIER